MSILGFGLEGNIENLIDAIDDFKNLKYLNLF